ncbi:MAG: nitroreductase family protein [Acidobacteriota bacterium]
MTAPNDPSNSPLDVPRAIRQRRSVKSFRDEPISSELLRELLELTVAAPSSWNLQDWRIVVIQDEERRERLMSACYGQKLIGQAPLNFVFAAHPKAWRRDLEPILQQGQEQGAWPAPVVDYFRKAIPEFQDELGHRDREYAVKDAMIAATHLVLAAESLGLASCFMNGWDEDQVKGAIGAEEDPDLAIAVVIPVGWPAAHRPDPGRLALDANVYQDDVSRPYSS